MRITDTLKAQSEQLAVDYQELYSCFDEQVENLVKRFGSEALLDVHLENGQNIHLQRWERNDWWLMLSTPGYREQIFDRSFNPEVNRDQLTTGRKNEPDDEWSASFSKFRSGRFSEVNGQDASQLLDTLAATALALAV